MAVSFKTWMARVDALMIETVGMPTDCWPDQNYYDFWEADYSPKEMLAEAIESEYGDEGLEAFGLESSR